MGIFDNTSANLAASAPPVLQSADIHNIAGGEPSWFESFSDAMTLGTQATVASGVNSIINSAVSISNFALGTDYKELDTEEQLKSYDLNVAKYYQDHQTGVDLAGFVATSLIPGTLGVKALRVAQAGNLPFGISKVLNIGKAVEDIAIKEAKSAIQISDAVYGGIKQRAAIKGFIGGAVDNVIEGLAFETAVAATMFESPILAEQDASDIFLNMGINAGVFGVVGGALKSVGVVGKVREAIESFDKANKPNTRIIFGGGDAEASTNVILLNKTLNSRPTATTAEAIELQKKQVMQVDNEELKQIVRLAGDDVKIAEKVQEANKAVRGDQQSVNSVYYGLKTISRIEDGGTQGLIKSIDDSNKNIAGMIFDSKTQKFVDALDKDSIVPTFADFLPKNAKIVAKNDELLVQASNDIGITRVRETFKIDPNFNPGAMNDKGKFLLSARAAEAHYRWALDPAVSITAENSVIAATDFPRLEKALRENITEIRVRSLGDDGKYSFIKPKTPEELENIIFNSKVNEAKKMLVNGVTPEEVATRLNVSEEFILDPAGSQLVRVGKQNMHELETPRYLNFAYDTESIPLNSRNAVINDAYVQAQIKLELDARGIEFNNWLTADLPEIADSLNAAFPDVSTLQRQLEDSTTRVGAGPSRFGFANGEYDSFASSAENIGSLVAQVSQKMRERTQSRLAPHIAKFTNNENLSREWLFTEARVRGAKENYVLNPDGSPTLVREDIAINRIKETEGKRTSALTVPVDNISPEIIELSDDLHAFYRDSAGINAARRAQAKQTSNGYGFRDVTISEEFGLQRVYPLPPNLQREKFFAFVRQEPTVQGSSSHVTIITAQSQDELTKLSAQISKEFPTYQIINKGENVAYRQARNDFEYGRGLNDNYIDSSLRSKGILGQVIPRIGPNTVSNRINDMLEWNSRMDTKLVRDKVEYRYAPVFQSLIKEGERFTNAATSKFENISQFLSNQAENPYASYIKTALNISRINEYPLWHAANEWVDRSATAAFNAVRNAFKDTRQAKNRTITDEEAAEINSMSERLGFGTPYKAAMELAEFDQPLASNPLLSRFISRSQAILSGTALTTDVFNAVNNAVGNLVLTSAESSFVINAIKAGNKQSVGQLADLAYTFNPANPQQSMLSPAKLFASSISRFVKDDGTLVNFYKDIGVDVSELDQHRLMMDALAISGKETGAEFNSKLDVLLEAGRKLTGNKFVESFNRFIAGDMMKQLTDLAIAGGKMEPREATSYIRTFVNRTQGNVLASQRPVIFQGPIGQAIGLFQTYQFNLIQQSLRYAKNQNKMPLIMLGAMQNSLYGLQGLPGFNAVSTHLVGNAYGNVGHDDLYTSTYDVAGKTAGDWLLYGMASNILGTNLYTRGDINPRQLTVLPVMPQNVPIVTASARFFGNLLDMGSKIAGGADISNTLLQGLEHNGLSRPLAGLAQVMSGAVTTSQGSLLATTGGGLNAPSPASMDMFRLSNLARIAGSKPMDESIAFDALYRTKAYEAKDALLLRKLGERAKTQLIGNGTLEADTIETFMEDYAKAGGNMRNFNRWIMKQTASANTATVNEVTSSLNKPLAQNLMKIMGGRDLPDFNNGLLQSPLAEESAEALSGEQVAVQ